MHADMERDRFFKADQAVEYGLIDRVIERHSPGLARAGARTPAPAGAAHAPRAAFGQAARASGAAPTSASSAHTTPASSLCGTSRWMISSAVAGASDPRYGRSAVSAS